APGMLLSFGSPRRKSASTGNGQVPSRRWPIFHNCVYYFSNYPSLMTTDLQTVLEKAWDDRANLSSSTVSAEVRDAVGTALAGLDAGTLRVAEKKDGDWIVNQWLKKAVLLSFRLNDNVVMNNAPMQFFDKVPLKFQDFSEADFKAGGYRVVPNAVAR